MRIARRATLLIVALLLLLPTAGLAWAPEGWFDTVAALPEGIRDGLPADESFLACFYNGDTAYLCTEANSGARRVRVYRETGGSWSLLIRSVLFPHGNGYDASFGSTSRDKLYLFSGEACFVFAETAGGEWRLSYVQTQQEWSWLPNGIRWQDEYGGHALYGDLPPFSLSDMEPALLPHTLAQARLLVHFEGWAVVNNPKPQDRLHLRINPSPGAQSLGKYYSGSPVRILQTQGDWAQVEVYGVQGYMMLRYLTFGESMANVSSAFPYRVITKQAAVQGVNIYTQPDSSSPVVGTIGKGFGDAPIHGLHIIGAVGDDWYHVSLDDGLSGYVQVKDFWEGNG